MSFRGSIDAFLVETSAFLAASLAVQGVVFAGLAIVLLRTAPRHGVVGPIETLASFGVFNFALMFWGVWANYFWVLTAVGPMYFSVDPLVHWLPYLPLTGVSDEQWGGVTSGLRNGATIAELQALWWALAWPVWLAAVGTWLVVRRVVTAQAAPFTAWLRRPASDPNR